MNLIGILIALALEYSLSHLPQWRTHHWFQNAVAMGRRAIPSPAFWNSPLALLLLALPVPVGVALVDSAAEAFSPILGIGWAVLVLVMCLGPRDLAEEVARYANEQDRQDIGEDLRDGMAELRHRNAPQIGLLSAVLVQGHERMFGVLLWFFVLGPLGASIYRILTLLPRVTAHQKCGAALQESCMRFHDVAAWLPARITALAYTLAGSAEHGFSKLLSSAPEDSPWRDSTWHVLATVGGLSLREEVSDDCERESPEALQAAMSLVRRCLFILLAVFSLFTLGGWIA